MEKNNQLPALPSNYVTLSQLQERWLKEKQQRNLKEKEKEREAENQQLQQHKAQNDDAQPKIDAAKPVEASKNRGYRGRNRNFKGSSRGASSKEDSVGEAAAVEGNKSENTGNERKSNDSRDDRIGRKRKDQTKKWKSKKKLEQKEKGGETETQREKSVAREAQEPPAVGENMSKMAKVGETEMHREKAVVREKPEPTATIEKIGVTVKGYAIKRDLRSKNAGLVEKSVKTVEMEGEVKNVIEKSKDTIKIEKSIGDLSLNEGSDRSETQNDTYNRRNMEYRTRSSIVGSSYSKHRVRTVNRRDSEYRGFNGGFNRRSAGRYRRWKDGDSGNEMVWVKKEVAVGTNDA